MVWADAEQGNRLDLPIFQPLDHLKNSLSKFLPASTDSPLQEYSRRAGSWWSSPPVALPWMARQDQGELSAEAEISRDTAAVDANDSTELPIGIAKDSETNIGADDGENKQDDSRPVKRRQRSRKDANLPLTLRIAYRELRAELWGEPGEYQDDEAKATLEEKRKKWVKRFNEERPIWKIKESDDMAAAEKLSGRLVHVILLPCLCMGGFVFYLAMAYGFFPMPSPE